ncbi:hypothetical protein M9Y10_007900 [Tritrichomonas musculus]|uniref:receptor protein-tyrosine kinase n=1 Tax=Tritrichomonas musculus TaxID=1915356 RepID=A0ABR2J2S8_9EUKA
MSVLSFQNFDQGLNSDINDDDNFENDDLFTFQHNSKNINLYYSQLTKYSKHIRETYLFSDVNNRLPQEIHQLQEESRLLPESVDLFFQLLEQNYDLTEDLILKYTQCADLLKICKFFEVRKLSFKIKQYIKSHNIEVDFIIQMLEYELQNGKDIDKQQLEISDEIENILTSKINECFSNEKFKELPTQIIYRVINKSSPTEINSNKLFDIIMTSLNKFCILLQFLDLQKLSEDRLEDLCEKYSKSNESTKHCFDYLKCNLSLINEITSRKKNLEEMNNEQRSQMKDLETKISSLQSQLSESKKLISDQQDKMKDLETLLQKQFSEQLQSQINYSKELESQVSLLQKQLSKLLIIKGKIIASVRNGLFINAEINLKTKGSLLDASRSKVIVSTSDAKCLGSEAYENGEPVTSLHMKTSFARKPGTYYVRCIVFSSEGESNEIVSNSVTTSGSNLTFEYREKKAAKISLPQGKYKLEVWGAKGGDSTGNGYGGQPRGKQSTVQGGLGGYSRGILSLNKDETVYVFVGEKGRQSNSPDGSATEGGFPDGGGTKTGHWNISFPTVPGTGGGSTSIRIGSDTDYSRVIVAGGGGGASGCAYTVNPGGFGGGQTGGNCYHQGALQSQGAGTQTGSTRGLGCRDGRHGDPGRFGSGATGKYRQGTDSGGGGGGGWYGGGGGGYGYNVHCSSGGGGSGWTFTDSSLKAFQSGDPSNASKFALSSAYYLTDVVCAGGNEEFPRPDGNGNERGHDGNGYAKITVL